LDEFRKKLKSADLSGAVHWANPNKSNTRVGRRIMEAAGLQSPLSSFAERVGLLKWLRHMYLVRNKGQQSVWVYNSPVKLTDWPIDYCRFQKQAGQVANLMNYETEFFKPQDMRLLADALQQTSRCVHDVLIKLQSPHADGRDKLRVWFTDQTEPNRPRNKDPYNVDKQKIPRQFRPRFERPRDTHRDFERFVTTYRNYLRQMLRLIEGNKVMFSDHPICRGQGEHAAAAVMHERLNVIYIYSPFSVFLNQGNSGRMSACVSTIIHELSHRVVGTEDFAYGCQCNLFPYNGGTIDHYQARNNADSWAYAAVDVAGWLSDADKQTALGHNWSPQPQAAGPSNAVAPF
jgi:hypothetical protein